jgi:hypothetical protein
MDALGLIRYEGEDLDDGIIASAEAITAIRGFDSSLRWWVARYDPGLSDVELPIPVRVNRGSWELELPQTIGHWLMTAGGVGATAYLVKAAQKLAERDFNGVGLRDAFATAFRGLRAAIRLGIHLGGVGKAALKRITWLDGNRYVEVEGRDGSTIVVRTDDLQAFLEMPSGRLSDLISLVTHDRTMLVISPDSEEDPIKVDFEDRSIFVVEDDEDDSETLFPELEHGMDIALEGFVTRGNEVANSIGFRYLDHILTCYPASGSIVRYKALLFTPCLIEGTISRLDDKNRPIAHRPKITFTRLTPLRGGANAPELNLD